MNEETNVVESGELGSGLGSEKEVVVLDPKDSSFDMTAGVLKALESTGAAVGDIGMKVARVPIEKYKASTQKIDRVAFITNKVVAVKFHYFDGVGSMLCFGKKCCELGGLPSVRYLFPIVVYSTDNEGNIVGKKLELRILSAGEDLYKNIVTINITSKPVGGIDKVDLLVTCTDDKYQKISLSPAGSSAWRKSKAAVDFIAERWAQDAEYIYMAVARKVDERAFDNLMGIEGGGQESPKFDESNTDLSKFFGDDN